jgi:hypothetical protein
MDDCNSALQDVSTTRSIGVDPGDAPAGPPGAPISTSRSNKKAGIADQGSSGGLRSYRTALPSNDGDKTPPGLAGTPIQGTEVGLDHDPGGDSIRSVRTDSHGVYQFSRLTPGKYTLSVAGQPSRSVTVGADGAIRGKLLRNRDGRVVFAPIKGD